MQKAIVFIYITLLLFSACGPSKEELAKRELLKADSIQKALSVSLEGMFGEPCNGREQDSTFKGLFSAFCPGDTSRNPPFCSFKKNPFDTIITKKKDTLIYFFKVSNVCCKKYYPNFSISLDTLILSYNFCGTECDCDCDYYLTYKIPTKKYKFKHIVLRTDQIISRNTK